MPRELRRTHNRELFRAVNDRIAELAPGFEGPEGMSFLCECATIGCTAQFEIPLEVYNLVRSDPDAFLVLRGHEDLEREQIVAGDGHYLIVHVRGAD